MYDTGEGNVGDFSISFFFTHLSLLAYDTGDVGVGDLGVGFLFLFLLTSLCLRMILEWLV